MYFYYPLVVSAYKAADKKRFEAVSARFLELIKLQDRLLGTRREFRLGTWISFARNMGGTDEQKDLYEWNARVQITTWGNRAAADEGGLHDYAHKEWNGLLRDFYHMRWKVYFDELDSRLSGNSPKEIDFYALEENWSRQHNPYSTEPEGNATDIAKYVYGKIAN